MAHIRTTISNLLLAIGLVLLFSGVTGALGSSIAGILASFAAVAMLLYAGAVWFNPRERTAPGIDAVLVFDRSLRVASGPRRGEPLTSCFPESVSRDVEGCCASALAGVGGGFSCNQDGARIDYEAVPVRAANGQIVYGILIDAAETARPAARAATV